MTNDELRRWYRELSFKERELIRISQASIKLAIAQIEQDEEERTIKEGYKRLRIFIKEVKETYEES